MLNKILACAFSMGIYEQAAKIFLKDCKAEKNMSCLKRRAIP